MIWRHRKPCSRRSRAWLRTGSNAERKRDGTTNSPTSPGEHCPGRQSGRARGECGPLCRGVQGVHPRVAPSGGKAPIRTAPKTTDSYAQCSRPSYTALLVSRPHSRPSLGPGGQAWGTLARGDAPTLPLIMRHNDAGGR